MERKGAKNSLGKGEVESSILSRSTKFPQYFQGLDKGELPFIPRFSPEQAGNTRQKLG